MRYDAVEIHFGELWLKGDNRNSFVHTLHNNIAKAIKGTNYESFVRERDRFMVYLNGKTKTERITGALRYIPGISWFSPVIMCKPTIQDIVKRSKSFKTKTNLRIEVKRSHKGHKFDSNGVVSAFLKANRSNDLSFPIDRDSESILHINIMKELATLCINRMEGIGGLPVGSSGNAVVLLSGGIDSPVASFYAMKRGINPVYLHFHTFPKNDSASKSKIPKLVSTLGRYSNGARIYYAPAYLFQAAATRVPSKYELVLFKRFMYRIAECVAELEDANAIVTGESIGQVASQTIENMSTAQSGSKRLILRPLSGFDKKEIIDKARELDTYELSIQPYKDVCSIKIKNPATRTTTKIIDKLYSSSKMASIEKRTEKLLECEFVEPSRL